MSFLVGERRRILLQPKRALRGIRTRAFRDNGLSDVSAKLAEPIPPIRPTDPPGPTIVLLNDCHDQDNFGAHALVDGLYRILMQTAPDATVQPIPSHWLLDVSNGLGAFNNGGAGMRQLHAAYPAVADQFEVVAEDWLHGRGGPGADELLSRLQGADLVVLNGEGSVYRTNLSAIRELFIAWLCKCRLGIPTIFVNGTVHLTDVMPILPAMVRKTLPALDAVAVREPHSLRNLAHYAPDVAVQLIPDSAFALTPDDARETSMSDFIRDRIGDAPYFCFDPGPMPLDHRPGRQSALYRLITALKDVTAHAVFVRAGRSDGHIEEIAKETNSLYIDTEVGYREWMTVARDAQFLLTGRYHNPILAAIMGCPSVTLGSSSHKVHGGCEMLEVIGNPYDGTDLVSQTSSIVGHARDYVQHRAEVHGRLTAVCERRRTETMELSSLMSGVLRSSGVRGDLEARVTAG
ncbi:MAG: polysaccharide pyruvyl transferase family protein [Acidimicrobiales bacterium]